MVHRYLMLFVLKWIQSEREKESDHLEGVGFLSNIIVEEESGVEIKDFKVQKEWKLQL